MAMAMTEEDIFLGDVSSILLALDDDKEIDIVFEEAADEIIIPEIHVVPNYNEKHEFFTRGLFDKILGDVM